MLHAWWTQGDAHAWMQTSITDYAQHRLLCRKRVDLWHSHLNNAIFIRSLIIVNSPNANVHITTVLFLIPSREMIAIVPLVINMAPAKVGMFQYSSQVEGILYFAFQSKLFGPFKVNVTHPQSPANIWLVQIFQQHPF